MALGNLLFGKLTRPVLHFGIQNDVRDPHRNTHDGGQRTTRNDFVRRKPKRILPLYLLIRYNSLTEAFLHHEL